MFRKNLKNVINMCTKIIEDDFIVVVRIERGWYAINLLNGVAVYSNISSDDALRFLKAGWSSTFNISSLIGDIELFRSIEKAKNNIKNKLVKLVVI
jgi:hypothetical protein